MSRAPTVLCLLLPLAVLANVDQYATFEADSDRALGELIGARFAPAIRETVRAAIVELEPYLATAAGKAALKAMISANVGAYPEIAAEYKGLAVGANITTQELLQATLLPELSAMARAAGFKASTPKQCTDYHAMAGHTEEDGALRAWVHNEDETPDNLNRSFVVSARRRDTGFVWTGFIYAPDVVGWAWSFNSHGMAQSVNALMPTDVRVGIGVNFLARDVSKATSLADAQARACAPGLASGQHFNLGSVREKDMQLLIETSPQGCDVRRLVPPPPVNTSSVSVAFHANMYESAALKGIDVPRPSTLARMARCAALPAPRSTLALIGVASDRESGEPYPIHRDAAPPDVCLTMNTVLFDAQSGAVHVWGQDAPVDGSGTARPWKLAFNWTSSSEQIPRPVTHTH